MDDFAASLKWQQLQNYLNVGASALYIYEFWLTLPWQIRCFWNRRFSHVSAMLYLNCYLNCVVCVMTVIGLPSIIKESFGCKVWFYFSWALSIINLINFQSLCAIRLWAICGKRNLFLMPVIITTLIAVSMNVVVYFRHVTFTVEPFYGCNTAIRISDALDLQLSYVNKIASVVSESWATAAVTYVLYPSIKAYQEILSPHIKIILEDNLLGFLTMLFMSTLDLLYLKYFRMNNPLPTAFDLINAILVADLLYKLRSVDDHEAYIATTESDSTHMAYQDHVISMTLGTPTVDEDTIAAIKTTLSSLPKDDSDALECNASSDADTTGDRSSIMRMDVLRLGAWEEEFGSEPLGEGDITDDVQWGGPLRPISSSRSETQSHCSGFTENFSHV